MQKNNGFPSTDTIGLCQRAHICWAPDCLMPSTSGCQQEVRGHFAICTARPQEKLFSCLSNVLLFPRHFKSSIQFFTNACLCEGLVDTSLRSYTTTQAITEALASQLFISHLQYFVQQIVHFVHIHLHVFQAPPRTTERPDMTCVESSERPKVCTDRNWRVTTLTLKMWERLKHITDYQQKSSVVPFS